MPFQAQRGTQDVLPSQSHSWQWLEREFIELASFYGYREMRTPVFEDINLFVRSSGETSDIVTKEMYDFVDKGGRHVALKPEETAPLIRAAIEHNLCPTGTVCRFCYVSPIYRYERPQKGRFREAHQVGLELLGSPSVTADAEIIEITVRFYERLGLKDLFVVLNSLGRDDCRLRYRGALLQHAEAMLAGQTPEFQERVRKNPLRLLDSKDPEIIEHMRIAPSVLDFLEPEGQARFVALQRELGKARVAYRIDPRLVRGLDYYTDTVFEVHSSKLGAQSALCGGGRYDNLVKELGGSPTPSVGVAMGIERALMVLEEEGSLPCATAPEFFVAYTGVDTFEEAQRIASELRKDKFETLMDIDGKSLKSQLRQADRSGARFVVLVGEEELGRGEVAVRNLKTGEQTTVARQGIISVRDR